MGKQAIPVTALVLLTLAGCSSYRSYRQAEMAESSGDWDQAVLYYMEAVAEHPDNPGYRASLLRAKINASQAHFKKARAYYESGILERALVEYQQAVQLDPTNQSAMVELERVRQELAAEEEDRLLEGTLEERKQRARERNQPPVLNPRSNTPIDLAFPEPVPVKDIYRALGRAFGINVLFDPNLKDQEIAIELKEVTAQKALEILMRAAGHFYKVEDEHTIIIAADTPQNRRNYEELVIQTFFLSNAEVKDVVAMLRSLIDAKKIATNEQLNAIILRDTADKVKVAERIILANDKARSEVVVDVELLQIDTNKLRDLGILWPSQTTSTIEPPDGGENLRLSDVQFLDQSNWLLSVPSFVYNYLKTNTDAQLLAKPQIRISEGENATLLIGDRVPIPVTSFNTANTVGGNIVPITSFQYQEVGIQIRLEPRVHHNKEITLKLRVEVSDLSGQVESGGQAQPIIATRTIESTIRLQDGETNLLAGLIRSRDSNTKSGVPGLSEIPVIGRLFSNTRNNNQRTDLILTMTPHIIRAADITDEDLEPIHVGTESNITFRGGSPRVESQVEGPFDQGDGTSAEEIREMIQRRIQQLPRGLREGAEEGAGEGEGEDQGQPGVELVPPPSSLFGEEEGGEPTGFSQSGGNPFTTGNASSALLLPDFRPSIALVAATAPPPVAVRLSLAPQRTWVKAGEVFELTLSAETEVAVSHLPVTLSYDPEVLEVRAVEPGRFLGPAGKSEVLAHRSRPGELVLGASRLGELPGVSGSGEVARITFRALVPGTARVRFKERKALDRALRPVGPLAVQPARVDVLPRLDKPSRPPDLVRLDRLGQPPIPPAEGAG